MSTSRDNAVRKHRRRLKQRGLKRVEVEAAEADASLIRRLARVLRQGGESADEVRRKLREIMTSEAPSPKALLASAPLEDIRITRARDRHRDIEL